MNILMICYYYPPLMDVGCKRSISFSENFKKYGWNPFVISVRNPDKHFCLLGKDVPPPGVDVEYTYSVLNIYYILGKLNGLLVKLLKLANIELKRNYLLDIFSIPDIFLGWIPLTVVKGVTTIRKRNIDVIYVSCSPFSSAIIGVLLKKLTKRPLVVDFRDPYALDVLAYIIKRPKWRIKLNQAIESWIIKSSDVFIVNTEEVQRAYLDQYPVTKDKTYVVTNGFDFRCQVDEQLPKFDKFTIIYAGLFYFFDKRNDIYTEAFFRGMAILKSRNQISSENFQFLYFGDESQRLYQIRKSYSLEDLMICNERRPYAEVLQNLKKAHLQLLRIAKPMISTKLFEGIALNIPFLATIPGGEVETMIHKYSPASYVITERSPEKVADAIIDSMIHYERGSVAATKIDVFKKKYSRENLSHMMIKIINDKLSINKN